MFIFCFGAQNLINSRMGHVSDFSGLTDCEETNLSQTPSDLISPDNILDFNLNENLMPISSSFTDDIYRQANLYSAGNLHPFMHTDDDRSTYFDEPMFDLLFDSEHNFNIDFDASDSILGNGTTLLETDPSNSAESNEKRAKENGHSANQIYVHNPIKTELSIQVNTFNNCDIKDGKTFDSIKPNISVSGKTYTAETIMNSETSNGVDKQIPKIKIKLKTEPNLDELDAQNPCADVNVSKIKPSFEPEFSVLFSAPMTIADNVKLGRRRNTKSDDSEHNTLKKVVDTVHKKKSRHKKHRSSSKKKAKGKHSDIYRNFKLYTQNVFSRENPHNSFVKRDITEFNDNAFEAHAKDEQSNVNNYFSANASQCREKSSDNVDFHTYNNEQCYVSMGITVEKNEDSDIEHKEKFESSVIETTADSFEFDFANGSVLSVTSQSDNQKELNVCIDEFFEDIDVSLGDENIPDLSKSLIVDIESVKDHGSSKDSSFSSLTDKEQCSPIKEESVDTKPSNKSSVASELIDELHAHNQQLFKEIEISTPELELELSGMKNSIQVVQPKEASHIPQNCANGTASKQNGNSGHVENDMNSQNHLPNNKTLYNLSNKASVSETSAHADNGIGRPRKISTSSCSFTSKSSTSHRTYRKRQSRLSSSSSNSSDTEEFYNRPVKYDPATDTYCDEFGRVVRQSELKYYLNSSKSSHRHSHSNNGSSSSTVSRSKSPHHHSSRHKKHHSSRSSSRSHRKRRYSSSRSRSKSRSRGRKHKHKSDGIYRSPSSSHHMRKPHYMDLEENVKANEERRVMYVGDIPPGYTIDELKERFSQFGPIQDATIKSKTTSNCSMYIFGFVTFKNRLDACKAIENGNNNPLWPKFDLNFGGRRRFCNGNYTDLDGKTAEVESGWYGYRYSPHQHYQPVKKEDDFAELLRMEQKRLGMAKK